MKSLSIGRNTILAAALTATSFLFASGSVNAATYNVPLDLNPLAQSATQTVGLGSFIDYLNFNVTSSYPVVGGAVMDVPVSFWFNNVTTTVFNITDMSLALYDSPGGVGNLLYSSLATADYQPLSGLLAPGDYSMKISGVGAGTGGGMYTWTTLAQPVPEPETYAMLLAGLGVIGVIARRRKQHSQR